MQLYSVETHVSQSSVCGCVWVCVRFMSVCRPAFVSNMNIWVPVKLNLDAVGLKLILDHS